jgi:hypothetical protein
MFGCKTGHEKQNNTDAALKTNDIILISFGIRDEADKSFVSNAAVKFGSPRKRAF